VLKNLDHRQGLARIDTDIGELHGASDSPRQALASFERALAVRRKLVEESPETPNFTSELASTPRRRGIVEQRFRRAGEAVADYRQSIALLEGLTMPAPGDLYLLACNHSLLAGAAGQSGSGLSTTDREAEAAKALATLRGAIAAGWSDAAHLRVDPDLAPLRPRPDFQKLLADLEAKQPAKGP
jgi:hypothetical protein